MVYHVLIAIFQDFSHSLCRHVISFPEIMGCLVTIQNGKLVCKMGNTVVPLHDFPSNLVSVTVWWCSGIWSFSLGRHRTIYFRDGMSLFPSAGGLCLEPILWIFLSKGVLRMIKVLENLSDLPWTHHEHLMGSVSSLMVQGLVLSAVVDLLPKVP